MLSGNLEYLISSLPQLQFSTSVEDKQRVHSVFQTYSMNDGDINLITVLDDEASKYLSAKKAEIFKQISLNTANHQRFQEHGDAVLSGFSSFLSNLKEKIKLLRLSRNQDTTYVSSPLEALQLKPGNPLEEELQLLELQWHELEELSIGHFSDFSALIAYKIKLLLLQRLWSFDETEGFIQYSKFIKITEDNG
ncbi:hypothetical protein [Winogradskyella helgolandensis]|uniref:hypothetical protein n=1 Tax=Winogradskyella helgolandensis TaxID=2697010 RepID=UPI0015CC54E5|nr:hypothetical protein [Winogradskyella helgolandensis]